MRKIFGKIFNIQRFSIYDGPGIRTVAFFAGCNLNCAWCHNPESISARQQLKFGPEQCILCGGCVDICKNGAHAIKDGLHIFERDKCEACLECAKKCYAEALLPVCRELGVAELEDSLITDEPYFRQSGGGVTFSGGEPLLQVDFLRDILQACKKRDIHTAVDTAGAVGFEAFEKILPWCDLFLYDIKAHDSDLHQKLTGAKNELILKNSKRLSELSKVRVRVPVVAGADGNIGEMEAIAKFLSGTNIEGCELLAYHRLGEGKYRSLGLKSEHIFEEPSGDMMRDIKNMFLAKNITII